MDKSLDALIRSAALASTLVGMLYISPPLYAQEPAPESLSDAYYIDPERRDEKRWKKQREKEQAEKEKKEQQGHVPASPAPSYSRPAPSPVTFPAPEYAQPSPAPHENPVVKAGSKILWGTITTIGVASMVLGFSLDMDWCDVPDGGQQSTCEKNNRDARYVLIGGGLALTGLGLWGLLGD